MGTSGGNTVIRTVCRTSDFVGCGLTVAIEDGVIVKVRPADFPDQADRGACLKGLNTHQIVYHPDRLRYPMKRTGERGEGKWQRVTWDEALNDISGKLKELTHRYGSNATAWMTPVSPNLTWGGYARLASLTKGTLVDWWGCGDSAGPCADIATFGHLMGGTHLMPAGHPQFIIIWGYNPAVTVYHYMRRIVQAKKKGAKVVVIDPRFTDTARHADQHIAIRPGTDGALALGMINVIMQQGLRDRQFIAENTVGPLLVKDDNGLFLRESDLMKDGSPERIMIMDEYTGRRQGSETREAKPAITGTYSIAGINCQPAYQLLADMVRDYTPERVSEITDIPADVIQRLAVNYATHKPAAIYRGWGMQRTFYGDLACRAINTLAAITGNINLDRPSTFVLNSRPFLMPAGPYNVIPVMLLYDAITKNEPFAIKAVWCAGHNFVNQMPNMNRVVDDFFRHLELVVVCDLFMTASARYADYVLPAASFYECTDLCMSSLSSTYLQLQQKAIAPLYESKSDFQIAAELGQRMGFGDYFNKTEEQYIEEILASGHPTMEGVSLEQLRKGPIMAKPLERPQQLSTPTGRIEFYVERLKRFGQELPIYLEPVESIRSEKAKKYPLSLLTTHPSQHIHSSLANVPSLHTANPEPLLGINPVDAEPRNIRDGDVVRVFNNRGQVKLKAKLSSLIKPGVVDMAQGWWPEHYIEGHHNQLTHERLNPVQQFILGPNAAFGDVLVEVERAPSGS